MKKKQDDLGLSKEKHVFKERCRQGPPALGRQEQEDQKLKVILSCMSCLRPAKGT